MRKEKIYMFLVFIVAAAFFAGGSYILVTDSLKSNKIDFSWTSNIFFGICGVLVLVGVYFNNIVKEKEKDLFSD